MEIILLHNKQSIDGHYTQLKKFETSVYNKAFRDPNERENFDKMINRIKGLKMDYEPQTYMVIASEDDCIYGCLITDYYEKCKALELIYLVVDPDLRKKGVGKTLMLDGTSLIIDHINTIFKSQVLNVYLECNNPVRTKIFDDFDAITRLNIFEKMGARAIDIPYLQPALDQNKNVVDNLILLSLKQFNIANTEIESCQLMDFLTCFYEGLGFSCDNKDLKMMKRVIETKSYYNYDTNKQYIKLLPIIEVDDYSCQFADTTITIQYISKEGTNAIDLNDNKNCQFFNSYQTDLMNYSYQSQAPFTTSVNKKIFDAEIVMPNCYEYTSEGNRHIRITNSARKRIKANISICYSYKKNSQSAIVHLAISPADNDYFTELDIIKLSHIFGSKQEDVVYSDVIKVRCQSMNEDVPIDKFIENLYGPNFVTTQTGLIQIELDSLKFAGNPLLSDDACSFYDVIFSDSRTVMKPHIEHLASIICGVTLGIFDFERMNSEEIFDTIRPIVCRENSCVVMNRGNILKISYSAQRESLDKLIPSPYLLIPSTVLVFNETLTNRCLVKTAESINKKLNVNELEDEIESVLKQLNTEYIQNIFQYPSEKEIMVYGNSERLILTHKDSIMSQINILKSLLENKRSRREKISQTVQTMILTALTTSQVFFLFEEIRKDTYSISSIWMLVIITTIILLVIFALNVNRTKQR